MFIRLYLVYSINVIEYFYVINPWFHERRGCVVLNTDKRLYRSVKNMQNLTTWSLLFCQLFLCNNMNSAFMFLFE